MVHVNMIIPTIIDIVLYGAVIAVSAVCLSIVVRMKKKLDVLENKIEELKHIIDNNDNDKFDII